MAFALTKFMAYGVDIAGPSKRRGIQRATLTITATVNDVALDFSADGGTFWTAARADATYGALATKALDILNQIEDQAVGLMNIESEQLLDRLQAAAAAGTSYTVAINGHRPDITCAAANGETAWVFDFEWILNDGIFPVIATYG